MQLFGPFFHVMFLRDLVPFVQFKKLEKRPWRSATLSKEPATSLKVTLLHVCFFYVFYILQMIPNLATQHSFAEYYLGILLLASK